MTYQDFLKTKRAYVKAQRELQEVLEMANISATEWCMLAALKERPRTAMELTELLFMSMSRVSDISNRLRRAGHVRRRMRNDDRRYRIFSVTSSGRELLAYIERDQIRIATRRSNA